MKKNIKIILIILWPVLFGASQSQKTPQQKKDSLSNIIIETKQNQTEIRETLESIEVILPNKKLPKKQQVR